MLDRVLVREPMSSNAGTYLPYALAGRATLLADMERFEKAKVDWDRAMILGKAEMIEHYRLQRALTVVNLGDVESAVHEAKVSLDEIRGHLNKLVSAKQYVIGARVYAKAADLVRSDTNRTELERARAVEEYSLAAINMTQHALDAGVDDQIALRATREFDVLRNRADFTTMFEK